MNLLNLWNWQYWPKKEIPKKITVPKKAPIIPLPVK